MLLPGGLAHGVFDAGVGSDHEIRAAEIRDRRRIGHPVAGPLAYRRTWREMRVSRYFAWSRVYHMVAMPFLFIPITSASYVGYILAEHRASRHR